MKIGFVVSTFRKRGTISHSHKLVIILHSLASPLEITTAGFLLPRKGRTFYAANSITFNPSKRAAGKQMKMLFRALLAAAALLLLLPADYDKVKLRLLKIKSINSSNMPCCMSNENILHNHIVRRVNVKANVDVEQEEEPTEMSSTKMEKFFNEKARLGGSCVFAICHSQSNVNSTLILWQDARDENCKANEWRCESLLVKCTCFVAM